MSALSILHGGNNHNKMYTHSAHDLNTVILGNKVFYIQEKIILQIVPNTLFSIKAKDLN